MPSAARRPRGRVRRRLAPASISTGGSPWDIARTPWVQAQHEAGTRHGRACAGQHGRAGCGTGRECPHPRLSHLCLGGLDPPQRLGAHAAGRARELGLLHRRREGAPAGLSAGRHRRPRRRAGRGGRAAVSGCLSHRHALAGAPTRHHGLGARPRAAADQLSRDRHRLAHVGQLRARVRTGAVRARLRRGVRGPAGPPGGRSTRAQKRTRGRQEPGPLGGGAAGRPRPARLPARDQRAAGHAGPALPQPRPLPRLAARKDRLLLPAQAAQRGQGADRVPQLDRRPRSAARGALRKHAQAEQGRLRGLREARPRLFQQGRARHGRQGAADAVLARRGAA